MEDGGPAASYIIFIFLLLIDMFFYGFDAAIHNLNIKDIARKAENKDKRSRRLSEIMTRPERYVNTVQLITTLINLIMGVFFLNNLFQAAQRIVDTQVYTRWPIEAVAGFHVVRILTVAVATALLMYILLTFGVMIPKKIAAKHSERWAYSCINIVFYMNKLLSPLTGLISLTTRAILGIFGMKAEEEKGVVTEEEIITMVNEGHEQGVLMATEAEMITNIFEFVDKEARDIMTHRNQIVAIDKTTTLENAIEYMLSESKSRFPVYEENVDGIIGILHFRDVMRANIKEAELTLPICDIQGLIRDAVFVPETKNINALFQYMQQSKTQMVIVVDEYGQTEGIIAMEDILEEIVGNIMDEYDEEEGYISETENEDEYLIEGKTPLDELEERFSINFNEEEFDTLNGFLISKMDKIPDEDEKFDIDVGDYNFKIVKVENKMIQSILVTKLKTLQEGNDDIICQDIQNLQT